MVHVKRVGERCVRVPLTRHRQEKFEHTRSQFEKDVLSGSWLRRFTFQVAFVVSREERDGEADTAMCYDLFDEVRLGCACSC
jgi:hypothetical protein